MCLLCLLRLLCGLCLLCRLCLLCLHMCCIQASSWARPARRRHGLGRSLCLAPRTNRNRLAFSPCTHSVLIHMQGAATLYSWKHTSLPQNKEPHDSPLKLPAFSLRLDARVVQNQTNFELSQRLKLLDVMHEHSSWLHRITG
jgi:hypothetical protein